MKRNKKEDILLNTDNDDISMLAEIQTDPDEVTAMGSFLLYAACINFNVLGSPMVSGITTDINITMSRKDMTALL